MTKYLILAATLLLAACGENPVQVLPTDSLEASRIKFFNFGVNAPGVNFYAGNVKMTAILSATGSEATTGVTYGSVGNGGAYSQIAPGNYIVTKLTVAALTLLAPIAGADDGKTLHVISATAAAHQITAPANSINGAFSTALFGGAVGDCLNLIAYNGTWLVLPSTHITLS